MRIMDYQILWSFLQLHLRIFSAQETKTRNEIFEDIEILRFLDLDIPIKMLAVSAGGVAIDTPDDYERVKRLMSQ